MNRAVLVTPYNGTGVSTADAYRPRVADDYPAVKYADLTGQSAAQILPSPDAYTVQVICDGPTLAAIEADPAYVVLTAVPL